MIKISVMKALRVFKDVQGGGVAIIRYSRLTFFQCKCKLLSWFQKRLFADVQRFEVCNLIKTIIAIIIIVIKNMFFKEHLLATAFVICKVLYLWSREISELVKNFLKSSGPKLIYKDFGKTPYPVLAQLHV